ncbi:glycosyl transferase family 2 [Acetohalobium arabaticum DSM 5501]|uniref:Glycosyl transferase family 2 n=1 Tax=Acetohalobium arabaticum (strain ATCC 49924 / DSM 5501 / Z-7288) TaxID=574087 RepID=D9QRT7_ACEAZ|nr:glycosyltransferase family 2 protein [Acetohalobium arabaticum]ADL13228.1 glycosyl transferase family 2 [Acetohalobium arabaticum DSM 5501]
MSEVTVLVPAYNEADKIKFTIRALDQVPKIDEIIAINDGSTDNTAEIVSNKTPAKLIDLETNQGKGAALNKGLEAAQGKIISLVDADLEETAVELEKLLEPVVHQQVDMSIADFPSPEKKGGFGLVTNLAQLGLKFFTGEEFGSPLSGQRVLTREVIDYLNGFKSGFGVEVGLTIEVINGGFEVAEIPVEMSHRETGRDWKGFRHRGRQFKDVLKVLLDQLRSGR